MQWSLFICMVQCCLRLIVFGYLIAAVIYWDKPNEVNGSIIQAVFYCDANEAVLFIYRYRREVLNL